MLLVFDVDLMKFILALPQCILYFIKRVQKPQIFFAFDTFYHIEKNQPKNRTEAECEWCGGNKKDRANFR